MTSIPQFGSPVGRFTSRPGAYALVMDEADRLLVVRVRGRYHLPGGGLDRREDSASAVVREVREETGYTISLLDRIGEARQFLQTADLGPINKLGVYYRGKIELGVPRSSPQEHDHEVLWIDLGEFLASTAHEFHKWGAKMGAVRFRRDRLARSTKSAGGTRAGCEI